MQSESISMEPRRPTSGQEPIKATLAPTSPLGKLASTSSHTGVLLAEVILLPVFFLLMGLWLSPDDPLWIRAEFPWSWLAPIIIALRYGALAGLGSSAILLAAWFYFHRGQWQEFPQLYFLGGLIAVMLVGEFSSLWRAKARRAETMHHYLDQRLEHLVRQYYVLRLSHDRLEQELIGRPMSMRDALQQLNSDAETSDGLDRLLQLLAQYCQITDASIHTVTHDELQPQAAAYIGSMEEVDKQDPLLRQALETRRLCHVVESAKESQKSRYLIAAPFIDLRDEIYAVLLVKEMPFFALQNENLQVINLLLGYHTDGISAAELAKPLLAHTPDCPLQFAKELQRLSHIQLASGINSAVLLLKFSAAAIERSIPSQVVRMKRMLDEVWLMEPHANQQAVAILMPLGSKVTTEGFLHRLEQWALSEQHASLMEAGIYPHVILLDEHSPQEVMQRIHELRHA